MPGTNVFVLGVAVQSGKGAPASAPQFLTKVRSRDLMPNPERGRLEETGTGRDGGERETTLIGLGGSVEMYLRPTIAGLMMYGLLGANATAGAAAPFTHTATAASDQPWLTFFPYWGDTLFERYKDCKVTAGTIAGSAGQSMTGNFTIGGLDYEKLAAKPAGGVLDTGAVIRVPGVTYTVAAAAEDAITEFSMQIDAAQNLQQTTKITNSFMEPGLRTVQMTYSQVFEDLVPYEKANYGGPGGTTPSQVIHRNAWQGAFVDAANTPRLTLDVPNLAYMTSPLPVNANGEIAIYQITAEADPVTAGSIVSSEIINNTASYAPAA